jgi:flavin-dependent dehydrogenase
VPDVVIVGAGPAGAVAATLLARAGVRVCLIDRAHFPRPKLCGDTLNPGALGLLTRLGLAQAVEARGLQIDGMRVTGTGGVTIEGRYPPGLHGRSLPRDRMDQALVDAAVEAGADLQCDTPVSAPLVDQGGPYDPRVVGVRLGRRSARQLRAAVTIAADGRHSAIAFGLGLARHPARPRRWAIGAYAQGVSGMSSLGEMHIRRDVYIGVAPLPGGVTNVCLVRDRIPRGMMADPLAALRAAVDAEPVLRDRFAGARFVCPPRVLGPLAVDAIPTETVPDGLILAGDAAGFIDPMTGDGLRFAIRGGELAASAALRALAHGWTGVQAWLGDERDAAFRSKWRFNRALRTMVGSPIALRAATMASRVAPAVVRALIAHAGDCGVARGEPLGAP